MTPGRIAGLGLALGLLAGSAGPAAALDVDGVVAELRSLRAIHTRSPEELPTRFDLLLTAWQTTPRGAVLAGDPTPDEEHPYVLTHPIFRFRWRDGRTLLVDAGLSPKEARSFGRTAGWIGADPIVCGARAFGEIDAKRVGATVFTHLHVDHVDGLRMLCGDGAVIPFRLSPEQRASGALLERSGRKRLEELAERGCVRDDGWAVTSDEVLAPGLVGFPGLHRVAVPGHTPGSQLLVGFVAVGEGPPRGVVVVGDVVNHRAAIRHDRPKPWWYRKLLVREDDALQARNRALLARLAEEGFELLVNHHVPVPRGEPQVACE